MPSDENEVRWLAERLDCTLWSDGNGFYKLEHVWSGPMFYGAGSLDEIEERLKFCLECGHAQAEKKARLGAAQVKQKRRKRVTRSKRAGASLIVRTRNGKGRLRVRSGKAKE